MIARLHGNVQRLNPGQVVVDVKGVGYLVAVPNDVWSELPEATDMTLWTSTYVREDRLELFGFLDQATRTLFERLIAQSGIGPKTALDLCAVPRSLLVQAANKDDAKLLSSVKGVGSKTAEKLIVELKSLIEKQPELFGTSSDTGSSTALDQDALEALTSLGYDTPMILEVLRALPEELQTTEERVTAALRSL